MQNIKAFLLNRSDQFKGTFISNFTSLATGICAKETLGSLKNNEILLVYFVLSIEGQSRLAKTILRGWLALDHLPNQIIQSAILLLQQNQG